ncbi:hypothetical protein UPYG_G00345180 [Umbra pygmaea]|uniref:Interleukin-17 receptor C/E N-terminal domain-containing protein n=1 Tax=Umbra pygmaea TaxID=75934 RepID=A0ABD0VXK6_UMBPY
MMVSELGEKRLIFIFILMLSLYKLSLGHQGGTVRIQKCETRCSQGLQCKSKFHNFLAPCRSQPAGFNNSVVFYNVSLSTVMRCEGKQNCFLHLQAHTALQLSEEIHGVSICTLSAGMIVNRCRLVTFHKAARQRLEGQQVEVQDDFTEVWPSESVHVTLKTYPSYCGVTWTSTYYVPECSSKDLRSNIPECITGRLAYAVDSRRKELNVSVSDMLEGKDYHLRLCQKGTYTCRDTGATALIRKGDMLKNATLHYSRPFPCLCIEGWSATSDAPRVQVCPFKDCLDELWSGINYDPMEATLSWEPVCPVVVVISLCQKQGDNECGELASSSQNLNRDKITFSGVDPHPQLCMKFTTDSGSWIRCPFAEGKFQAWDLDVKERDGQQQLVVTSWVKAPLSLHVCVMTGTFACHTVHTFHVHLEETVSLNLTMNLCHPDTCLQVKRLHVKYGATILYCNLQCSNSRALAPAVLMSPVNMHGYWVLTWIVGSALISTVTMTAILAHILSVYQRHRKEQNGGCLSKQLKEPTHVVDHGSCGLQDQATLHQVFPMPETPQFKNSERANLLTEFAACT